MSAEAPAGDAAAAVGGEEEFDESVWDAEAKGPVQLGEDDAITVTVDRRKQDIQKYAGSAQAFSQQDLERTGVNSVRDLANATPYMEIGNQEGNLQVYIRGVGTDYGTELGDPAAAVHFDGAYVPRPRGVGSMFFDIERVEVNRGPQGTLRGRNATAGSLNIISHAPELKKWDTMASVQFGNYSQKLTKAMLNIPLGETLALRVATFTEDRESFYSNAGPIENLTPPENADTLAYRVSAKWQPTNNVSVVIRHDYTQEKGVGTIGSNYQAALRAGILPEEVPDPRRLQLRDPQGYSRLYNYGVSGTINVDFGAVNMELLSGYRAMRFKQSNSGSAGVAFPGQQGVNYDDWDRNYWHTESDSTVQELRFFAPDTSAIRWSAGANYFYEDQYAFLGSSQDVSNGFVGVEYNMPEIISYSYGVFADATFDITKALRGILGVRYTWEMKSRKGGIGNVYGFGGTGDFRYGTSGFQFAADNRSDFTIDNRDAPPAPFTDFSNGVQNWGVRDTLQDAILQPGVSQWGGNMTPQNGRIATNYPDFRAGLDFDINETSMVYGKVSSGHKSGGFNDNFTFADGSSIAATFANEKLISTEIGSKNQLFDKKLTVNASAYWYEYWDQQFSSLVGLVDPANLQENQNALSLMRFNAGRSRILGLDADLVGRLPAGFTGKLSGTLLDARFVRASMADTRLGWGAGDIGDNFDASGNYLPKAPVLSISYGIEQIIPTEVGYFDWMLRATTKTKQYMLPFNGEGVDTLGRVNPAFSDVVPSYTKVDAAAGYAPQSGAFRLDAFVSNLTDASWMTAIINNPDLNLRFFNTPRQYGVRFTAYML